MWPRRWIVLTLLIAILGSAQAAPPRLAVPDEPSQDKARTLARQVFAADFAEARKSAEKGSALAAKLLAQAVQTPQAVERYVLLRFALESAIQAGDVAVAMKAAGELDKAFQVDAAPWKLEALKTIGHSARGSEQSGAILRELGAMVEDRIAADDYPAALEAARLAVDEARKTRDPALRKHTAVQLARADQLAAAYQQLQGPLETLGKAPDDATAHLAVGKFLCLAKGDWQGGLPHLAKGNGGRLSLLAETELQFKSDSPIPSALSLADGWWAMAEAELGAARGKKIRSHAEYWYRLALPGLAGLDKARVAQLLADIPAPAPPPTPVVHKPGRRPPPPKIKILQAMYGKPKKGIDVTAAIQAAVAKDPYLPIRADTVLTGGVDPAPYQQRLLLLRYQVGKSVVLERFLREGTVETIPPVPKEGLSLPEASDKFTVVAARCGAGVTWIDVTAHVAKLVSDPTKPFNFNGAAVADDEARKTCHALVVWFDYQHRRYVRVFEHSRKCVLLP